jgi:hypothetical protein
MESLVYTAAMVKSAHSSVLLGLRVAFFALLLSFSGCEATTVTAGSGGACTPDCAGRWCGDDSCGGQCGVCPDWAPICDQGSCQMAPLPGEDPPTPEDDVSGPGSPGADATVDTWTSPQDGGGPRPGADSSGGPDGPCIGNCVAKMCGDDGCGGSCGLCPPQAAFCDVGQCSVCDIVSCAGQFAGNPDALCSVYDPQFGSGLLKCQPSCELDTSLCVSAAETGQHGAPCVLGQAGSCEEPYSCMLVEAAQNAYHCLVPCSVTAACPEGWSCVSMSAQAEVCMPATAPRDTPCWENFQACQDPTHQCMNTASTETTYVDWRCKIVCDDFGSQDVCAPGESCLKNTNGHMNPVKVGGAWKICNPTSSPCGPSESCLPVGGGSYYCYAAIGWCGTSVPICGGLTPEDQASCAVNSPCEATDASLYCAVGNGDPASFPNPGFAVCVDVPGVEQGACVGFCELETGEIAQCGAGYTCVQPTPDQSMLFYKEQPNGPNTCTNGFECDSVGQYFCATLSTQPQPKCYRGYRMCQAF